LHLDFESAIVPRSSFSFSSPGNKALVRKLATKSAEAVVPLTKHAQVR
jgi:hypothetical protein